VRIGSPERPGRLQYRFDMAAQGQGHRRALNKPARRSIRAPEGDVARPSRSRADRLHREMGATTSLRRPTRDRSAVMFTLQQVITEVGVTETDLNLWIEQRWVLPGKREHGFVFDDVHIARAR